MFARAAQLFAWIIVWAFQSAFAADGRPLPPCGTAPHPPYASVGAQPNLRVWSDRELTDWTAPSCLTGASGSFGIVLALAGSIRHDGTAEKLLEHMGTLSAMRGMRYWSVTDKAWRVLITDAAALDGPDRALRRADFTAADMKAGKDLFFAQRDSRSTGEVVYRMRVREIAHDRVVVETENLTPVRSFFVTLFRPGELRVTHFFERRTPDLWGYYLLSLVGGSHAEGHAESFVNRAAALYRYAAGQRPDEAPPLAP